MLVFPCAELVVQVHQMILWTLVQAVAGSPVVPVYTLNTGMSVCFQNWGDALQLWCSSQPALGVLLEF